MTLTAVVLLLIVAGLPSVRGVLRGLLPSLSNPFAAKTVDRSGPALLVRLADLARFQAATGSFTQVVDVEKDVPNVPAVFAGKRTLLIAYGDVYAYVDFTGISKDAVTVSADDRRVNVVLPPAVLSDVQINLEESYVAFQERGVLDRLGDVLSDNPNEYRDLYLAAQTKIGAAARTAGLQKRAEDNTRSMLTGLLGTLGYTDVHVEYKADHRR